MWVRRTNAATRFRDPPADVLAARCMPGDIARMSFRSTVPLVALLTYSVSAGAQSTAALEAEAAAAAARSGPEMSVRLDPFNWVLEGRLGLELEVALSSDFSLELVPVFVTSESPPTLNLSGREDNLLQSSNGVGPLSGDFAGGGLVVRRQALSRFGLARHPHQLWLHVRDDWRWGMRSSIASTMSNARSSCSSVATRAGGRSLWVAASGSGCPSLGSAAALRCPKQPLPAYVSRPLIARMTNS